MKNEFALDFAPDRVKLISEPGEGQDVVGEVAFDDPFFGTRLEDLRKEVEADTDAPLSPTLLIPHSEVLFHTLTVDEGIDDAAREKAIRSELEGMTPYDVEDLVYDWKPAGQGKIQIAAVARDTLDEADDFAAQHGFGPGAYSTPVNPGAFAGQPDFGRSARPEPLSESAEPEPDITPLPVPDTVDPQDGMKGESAPTPAEAAATVPNDAPDSAAPDAQDDPPGGAQDGMTGSDATTDVPVTTAKAEVAKLASDATGQDSAADPAKPVELSARKTIDSGPTPGPATPPTPVDTPSVGAAGGFASRRLANTSGQASTTADSTRLGDIASRIAMMPDGGAGPKGPSMAQGKIDGSGEATVAGLAATGAALTAAGAGAGAATLPPRRGPGPAAPTPTVRRVDPPSDSAAPSIGEARPRPALSEAEALTVFGMRDTGRSSMGAILPVVIGLAVALILALVIWSVFFFLNPVDDPEETALAVPEATVAGDATELTPLPRDEANLTPDEVRPPGPNSDSVDAPLAQTEPDTRIAALPETEAQDEPVAETPPVAVADTPEQPLVLVEENPATEATPDPQTAEPAEPQSDRPLVMVEETAPPASEPAENASAPTNPEPSADDPLRRPADAPEETRYAATGVSTSIPDAPDAPPTQTAEMDAAPVSDSTVALRETAPTSVAPDVISFAAPAALIPPPPADARFDFGPDGRVVATPGGVLTPQGVRVTAGAPARVPPQAPDRAQTDPEAATEPAPQADATPQAAPVVLPADEQGLDIPVNEGAPVNIPPSRPGGDQANADDAAEGADVDATRVALGSTALTALSGITPRPRTATPDPTPTETLVPTQVALLTPPRARPGSLTAEPEAEAELDPERAAETAAAIAAILPEAVPAPEPIVATSPYAVGSSLLPVGRPRGFAQRVEQRRAALAQQQAARQQAQQQAAQQQAAQQQAAQQQQAEPVRVATAAAVVTPRNPTAGSVASRATEPNKIKLNAVNLIGVYGTQSNRRALVRLPNGRFVKVKVGDKVDGGRVSAIGADALRYEKRGRSLTLTMPSG